LGLLDGNAGPAPSKVPLRLATSLAAILVVAGLLVFLLRYHKEKATIRLFLDQVCAGDFQSAYRTWKPSSSYAFQDFMADWGPKGEYGPVKSFQVVTARRPGGASGVVISVEVSPYAPFPDKDDPRSRENKEVRLWVESSDQSLSYAPTEVRIRR
jgi:hypothetical protein